MSLSQSITPFKKCWGVIRMVLGIFHLIISTSILRVLPPSLLVNWFNNGYIKEQNHRVNLLLKIPGMPRHSEIGGWLRCVDKKYGFKTIRITPQHFLNGVIDWDSDI